MRIWKRGMSDCDEKMTIPRGLRMELRAIRPGRRMERNIAELIRPSGFPPPVKRRETVLTDECCRRWALPPPSELLSLSPVVAPLLMEWGLAVSYWLAEHPWRPRQRPRSRPDPLGGLLDLGPRSGFPMVGSGSTVGALAVGSGCSSLVHGSSGHSSAASGGTTSLAPSLVPPATSAWGIRVATNVAPAVSTLDAAASIERSPSLEEILNEEPMILKLATHSLSHTLV